MDKEKLEELEKRKKQDLFLRRLFLVSMAIVIVMMIIGLMVTYHQHHPHPQKYPMTTVVTHVSRTTNTVTVQDFNGNLWQFKGVEDWDIGDICSCIMSDNGTELIDDDKIVKVKYDGRFSGWK